MTRPLLAAAAGAAAVAALAVITASAQTAPPQVRKPADQVFRAAVEMVSLNVTVLDQQNRLLTDLDASDFLAYEDGVKQEVTYFNRSTLPIALSLLIDTSASMEQRMGITQEAAVGFARKLRPQDLAQVVDFDTRVEILQDFTSDPAALEQAIRSTTAGGSTSMHNALYISLKELAKIKPKSEDDVRRRAVVLLSDGEDTSSLVSFEEVLDLAKRSATTIYTIGLQTQGDGLLARAFARPSSCSGNWRRKPAAAPSSRNAPRISPPSTASSPMNWPASTRSATPRRTRSATAAGGGSTCR